MIVLGSKWKTRLVMDQQEAKHVAKDCNDESVTSKKPKVTDSLVMWDTTLRSATLDILRMYLLRESCRTRKPPQEESCVCSDCKHATRCPGCARSNAQFLTAVRSQKSFCQTQVSQWKAWQHFTNPCKMITFRFFLRVCLPNKLKIPVIGFSL